MSVWSYLLFHYRTRNPVQPCPFRPGKSPLWRRIHFWAPKAGIRRHQKERERLSRKSKKLRIQASTKSEMTQGIGAVSAPIPCAISIKALGRTSTLCWFTPSGGAFTRIKHVSWARANIFLRLTLERFLYYRSEGGKSEYYLSDFLVVYHQLVYVVVSLAATLFISCW